MDTSVLSVLRLRMIAAQTESVFISVNHARNYPTARHLPVYNFCEMAKLKQKNGSTDFASKPLNTSLIGGNALDKIGQRLQKVIEFRKEVEAIAKLFPPIPWS